MGSSTRTTCPRSRAASTRRRVEYRRVLRESIAIFMRGSCGAAAAAGGAAPAVQVAGDAANLAPVDHRTRCRAGDGSPAGTWMGTAAASRAGLGATREASRQIGAWGVGAPGILQPGFKRASQRVSAACPVRPPWPRMNAPTGPGTGRTQDKAMDLGRTDAGDAHAAPGLERAKGIEPS